jgi:hypothetical protein
MPWDPSAGPGGRRRRRAVVGGTGGRSRLGIAGGRFSVDQRKRLHFLFERDPIGARREAGLSHTQLEQLVADEALDLAVMTRLTGFLTGIRQRGQDSYSPASGVCPGRCRARHS